MSESSMLKSHLDAIEKVLLAQSVIALNAGHPNLRGGPREWFIHEFLMNHLPETLSIGQGEVIDVNSVPESTFGKRPQMDIVLYRRDLPIIHYAPNAKAFFSEGVMATIEIKSKLTKSELDKTLTASITTKSLERSKPFFQAGAGWKPDHIVTYLVAYDGPKKMSTIDKWLRQQVPQVITEQLPLDMIIILGRGILWNVKSFPNLTKPEDLPDELLEKAIWGFVDQPDQNLFAFFTHMLTWLGWTTSPPKMLGYAKTLSLQNPAFSPFYKRSDL